MKCALITAGGCGTRLYPLSTSDHPKQFVKMFGDKSLIQLTYERLLKCFDKNNIFIVLPLKYKHFISELLPDVKNENIIIEPSQRSTAPALLFSCLKIKELRGDSQLFVFPADHYIENTYEFVNCVNIASKYIYNYNKLVLFGIKPNVASTRYGYLKFKGSGSICDMTKFKEKPNRLFANLYYLLGNFYCSSDIYGFNISYMIELYKKYLLTDYVLLTNNLLNLNDAYELCTNTSVAYGIFEKTSSIKMLKCDFGWDDVGVFESLLKHTNNKNVLDAYSEKLIFDHLKNTENLVSDN